MASEEEREAELEAGRMPLLDHLVELRNRLMWSAAAILVAIVTAASWISYGQVLFRAFALRRRTA